MAARLLGKCYYFNPILVHGASKIKRHMPALYWEHPHYWIIPLFKHYSGHGLLFPRDPTTSFLRLPLLVPVALSGLWSTSCLHLGSLNRPITNTSAPYFLEQWQLAVPPPPAEELSTQHYTSFYWKRTLLASTLYSGMSRKLICVAIVVRAGAIRNPRCTALSTSHSRS